MLRTHTCGELNKKHTGLAIELSGWVQSRRDHGGIIFIDLRDKYGLTQITFDPEFSGAVLMLEADQLRHEWVVRVKGKVAERPEEMINPKLATGEIEVEINSLEILGRSKTPPFELGEEKEQDVQEQIRLKYRFVDLRRNKLQNMLKLKDEYIRYLRDYFHERGFTEVQTPILANSSPEGARDFLVPSRLYDGKFYALPQAPQQFKQLLMVGGMDKYFQVAPCFRDEDPRADRHYGEFYQLDMEMSFVEQKDIMDIIEPLYFELIRKFSRKKIVNLDENGRIRKIPWRVSMTNYGTDKPDLRFALEIQPITDMVRDCGFSVFADAVKKGGVVHALKITEGANFTRREIDELTEIAKRKGAKGLAYIVVKKYEKGSEAELQSPIIKFLAEKDEDLPKRIMDKVDAKTGDIIFFGADLWRIVCDALGAVRNECGLRLGLKDKSQAAFAWIVDFPMYEYSDLEENRVDFGHNPFSMPQGGSAALENKDPFAINAYQYDCAFNGYEILSGAIRNHDPEIMYQAFAIAGYPREEVQKRFGAMISAFEYGAPPHGGAAIGLDRFLMTMLDMDSIRDIYAFPKDGQGRDLMMDSPSNIDEKQLREAHIKLRKLVQN
jgi:aspartyl-tRNA synthetase